MSGSEKNAFQSGTSPGLKVNKNKPTRFFQISEGNHGEQREKRDIVEIPTYLHAVLWIQNIFFSFGSGYSDDQIILDPDLELDSDPGYFLKVKTTSLPTYGTGTNHVYLYFP